AAAEPIVTAIRAEPAEFSLSGHRSRQQLLVSGMLVAGEQADVTREAKFTSLTPTVAVVTSDGVVVPRGHGTAEILVRYGDYEAQVSATVTGYSQADPVDFNTDVIAALSKAACNQGACHGSPQGKNSFRLSLRGFDPALDFM